MRLVSLELRRTNTKKAKVWKTKVICWNLRLQRWHCLGNTWLSLEIKMWIDLSTVGGHVYWQVGHITTMYWKVTWKNGLFHQRKRYMKITFWIYMGTCATGYLYTFLYVESLQNRSGQEYNGKWQCNINCKTTCTY